MDKAPQLSKREINYLKRCGKEKIEPHKNLKNRLSKFGYADYSLFEILNILK